MNREEMHVDCEKEVAMIRRLRDFIDLMPDALFALPGADISPSMGGHGGWVHVNLPYDPEVMEQLRAVFSGSEWTLGRLTTHANDGDCKLMCIYHESFSGPHVFVKFDPRMKGSHCQLVEVGTREMPVFEIRCETVPGLEGL